MFLHRKSRTCLFVLRVAPLGHPRMHQRQNSLLERPHLLIKSECLFALLSWLESLGWVVSAVEVEVEVEVAVEDGTEIGMKAVEVVSVAAVVAVAAFEFGVEGGVGVGVSIQPSVLTDSSESTGWVSANAGRPRGGQPHFHSSAALPW
jgi:hypothetical protein